MCKHTTARGVWGHDPPEFLGEFSRGYEIASETNFWANTMLLGGQTTVFHVCEYLFTLSALCVVQYWFRFSDRLLISQATPFAEEACENKALPTGIPVSGPGFPWH